MARPFFSSSFCALMTGGRNAPSEGGPNTTIDNGSGACARTTPDRSSTPTPTTPAQYLFITLSPALPRFLSIRNSQTEQPLRQAAIDRGALTIRKFALADNFCGREIADRERHVR